MKIACICCTYLRAHLLGNVIQSFLEQDFPEADRELVILDDAGEYRSQSGDGWQLVSIDRRFRSLGEKRNAASALASADVEAFAIWDDDDLYLPHALTAIDWALRRAPLCRPGQVLYEDPRDHAGGPPERFVRHETGGLYHGGWAYRVQAFDGIGGYTHGLSNGEDQDFLRRMEAAGVETADPCENGKFDPYYIYHSETNNSYRMSHQLHGRPGWDDLGTRRHDGHKDRVPIGWAYDLARVPIADEILPRPF